VSEWIASHRQVWEFWFQLLTAIGTVGAVAVAVWIAFWQEWRTYRDRPKLKIGLQFCAPDCGLEKQLEPRVMVSAGGGAHHYDAKVDAYWFRLYAENAGRSVAREVEATVSDLTKKDQDGRWSPVATFQLSNLVWNHTGDVVQRQLLPGTRRHFALGSLRTPDAGHFARFRFKLSVDPVSAYDFLETGDYRFTIAVGAANADPVTRQFRLFVDGNWTPVWSELTHQHLQIEPV